MSADFLASLRPGDRVLRATRDLGMGRTTLVQPGDEVWIVVSVSPQRASVSVRRECVMFATDPEVIRGRKLASLRPVDSGFEARHLRDSLRGLAKRRLWDITGPRLDVDAVARLGADDARELAESAGALLAVARRVGVLR